MTKQLDFRPADGELANRRSTRLARILTTLAGLAIVGLGISCSKNKTSPTVPTTQIAIREYVRQIEAVLPKGWSVQTDKNIVVVSREKPVEMDSRGWPCRPHMSVDVRFMNKAEEKAYLKTEGFVRSGTYSIKIRFAPPMSEAEAARLAQENRETEERYYRKHPVPVSKTPRKPTAPPKELTAVLHPIPNILNSKCSIFLNVSISPLTAFYNKSDEIECQKVERAVLGILKDNGAKGRKSPATKPALPQPVLENLGKQLAIRVEAGSWNALVKKVKPTFSWSGRDMMWIGRDEKGNPQFTLDRAYIYKPKGKPARWVLLKFQDTHVAYDKAWIRFSGNYLSGIAKLHKKVPTTDHGSGEYAVAKSTDPKSSTVYEIGWQSTMYDGTGRIVTQRRLFVLRDGKGKWRFVGEGPVCRSGKMGAAYCYWYALRSKVAWTGKPNAPVRIELVQKRIRTQLTGSDSDPIVPKRDMITYRDATIEGKVPTKPHWASERTYMLAKKGDTFEKIVHHLATWTLGWDTNRGNDRQIILAMWKEELARLNPQLPQGKIPEGTRIRLLTYYAETIKLLDKYRKAATKPATKPGKRSAAENAKARLIFQKGKLLRDVWNKERFAARARRDDTPLMREERKKHLPKAKKAFNQAVAAFKEVRASYPKSELAAEAVFYLSDLYEKSRMHEECIRTCKELLNK